MILLYIFSMAISANLLQRCFYFAFQSSLSLWYRFALHVSACLTLWHCFDMGAEPREGACTTGLGTPPWEWRHRSQLIQAPSLSRGMRVDRFYSLALQHSCFNCINLLTYVYVYCIESLQEAFIHPPPPPPHCYITPIGFIWMMKVVYT